MEKVAVRGDWKIFSLPAEHDVLVIDRQYTSEEFCRISVGCIPKGMDDHWFITNQSWFTATLLTNGKVLITGGANGSTSCCAIAANPELYDPSTGVFSLAGPYAEMRVESFANGYSAGTSGLTYTAATLLSDGKVLILSELAAEVYDPTTNTFRVTGSMVAVDEGGFWGKPTQINGRTATLMPNEKVLVAGGVPAITTL